MTFKWQRSTQHQGGLNRTRQADFLGTSECKLEITVAGGEGKKKYPAIQCKVCAGNKE